MRERIYSIVQKAAPDDKISKAYDLLISLTAIISIVPLMFKEPNNYQYLLEKVDIVTVYILFLDYVFRWITHDYAADKAGDRREFLKYPFTLFAIVDLISILPSLGLLGPGFRILRMLRIFKVLHYSKNFAYVSNVFHKERKTLGSVLVIALAYIFVSALAMFSYEPETFDSFFDALYWATTALTTVGYGDVYPHSNVGQLISMVSSLFGIAVIALPAGIVTAGFVDEINKGKEADEQRKLEERQARLQKEQEKVERAEKKLADTARRVKSEERELREHEAGLLKAGSAKKGGDGDA